MYYKKLQELVIQLPEMKEQLAITEFMDIISREILDYKKLLNELTFQKKGLMQQLLTGKKRVNI
jgi:type I restriction enzyme S subunit